MNRVFCIGMIGRRSDWWDYEFSRHDSESGRGGSASLFEHRIFRHGEATQKAVLKAMPEYNVLHFSCHGKASFEKPMDGGLFMSDNARITLKDMFDLRLKGARLAVLSACETGITGTKLPDEVVHLPSGMMLLTRFCDHWRKNETEPPEALRQAQIWLRDSTNREKVDYFREPEKEERCAHDTLRKIYGSIGFSDPNGLDYAHPYYWTAFQYVGA